MEPDDELVEKVKKITKKSVKKQVNRLDKVEDCAICSGKPVITPFTAEPFKGEKCDECFRILNYERI